LPPATSQVPPIPLIPPIPVIPPIPGPAPTPSIPTEPLPRPAQSVGRPAAIAPPKAPPAKKKSFFRRAARYGLYMVLLSMTASECNGLGRADRLRDQIGALELADVAH